MSAKVTEHPQRQLIDSWLAEGLAFTEIEKKCKRELGLNISHMTIKRYSDGNADLAMARANSLNQSDIVACELVDDYQESALMIDVSGIPTDPDKVRAFTREALARIYLNQLLIVEHKQQAFMQGGKGKYPQNEIMGLKTILSCLGYISDDKDKTLDHEKTKAEN